MRINEDEVLGTSKTFKNRLFLELLYPTKRRDYCYNGHFKVTRVTNCLVVIFISCDLNELTLEDIDKCIDFSFSIVSMNSAEILKVRKS